MRAGPGEFWSEFREPVPPLADSRSASADSGGPLADSPSPLARARVEFACAGEESGKSLWESAVSRPPFPRSRREFARHPAALAGGRWEIVSVAGEAAGPETRSLRIVSAHPSATWLAAFSRSARVWGDLAKSSGSAGPRSSVHGRDSEDQPAHRAELIQPGVSTPGSRRHRFQAPEGADRPLRPWMPAWAWWWRPSAGPSGLVQGRRQLGLASCGCLRAPSGLDGLGDNALLGEPPGAVGALLEGDHIHQILETLPRGPT